MTAAGARLQVYDVVPTLSLTARAVLKLAVRRAPRPQTPSRPPPMRPKRGRQLCRFVKRVGVWRDVPHAHRLFMRRRWRRLERPASRQCRPDVQRGTRQMGLGLSATAASSAARTGSAVVDAYDESHKHALNETDDGCVALVDAKGQVRPSKAK